MYCMHVHIRGNVCNASLNCSTKVFSIYMYSCYDCYSGMPLEMYCRQVQIQRNLSLNSNKLLSIYLILAVLVIRRGPCWLSTRLALEESPGRRKVRSGGRPRARFVTDCSPSSFEPSDLSCSFGGARCCFGRPSVTLSGL